jgi:hypothetical protein
MPAGEGAQTRQGPVRLSGLTCTFARTLRTGWK